MFWSRYLSVQFPDDSYHLFYQLSVVLAELALSGVHVVLHTSSHIDAQEDTQVNHRCLKRSDPKYKEDGRHGGAIEQVEEFLRASVCATSKAHDKLDEIGWFYQPLINQVAHQP